MQIVTHDSSCGHHHCRSHQIAACVTLAPRRIHRFLIRNCSCCSCAQSKAPYNIAQHDAHVWGQPPCLTADGRGDVWAWLRSESLTGWLAGWMLAGWWMGGWVARVTVLPAQVKLSWSGRVRIRVVGSYSCTAAVQCTHWQCTVVRPGYY